MDVNKDTFLLIQRIQQVQIEVNGWEDILVRLCGLTSSSVSALYQFSPEGKSAQIAAVHGLDQADIHRYEEYYAARSLTNIDSLNYPTGTAYTDSMYPDIGELLQCEAYNDYFRPLKAEHMALVRFKPALSHEMTFVLRRSAKKGYYNAKEIQRLKQVYPFLSQGYGVWLRFSQLWQVQEAMHVAMDRLPYGILLLNGKGRLIYATKPAEQIIADQDGFSISREGLCKAACPNENGRLQAMVGNVVRAGLGQGIDAGKAMSISRPSMRRAYTLYAFPFLTKNGFMADLRPVAGIFICDPEHQHRPPPQMLCELFGLTQAEERLAILLMQGFSIKESGERLGISENTVRTHSKSIYSKTGVTRQGELIRLLFSSVAPLSKADRPVHG